MKMRLICVLFVIGFFVIYGLADVRSAGKSTEKSQTNAAEAKWQAMSEQEKQKIQDEINQGFAERISIGRKEQLAAISAIEQQVAKLKSAVESTPEDASKLQNESEAERTKYREKLSKAALERQKAVSAIDSQLAKLKPISAQIKEKESSLQISQLQEIRLLAVKEKAVETAKRLESLIAKTQQAEGKLQQDTRSNSQAVPSQQTQTRPSRPQEKK